MRVWHFLAAPALCLAAAPATAACELAGASSPATARVTYDPFAPTQQVLQFSVRVRNDGDQACRARLYLRPETGGASLTLNGHALRLRFEGQSRGGALRGGELEAYGTTVAARGSAEILVRAVIPAQQIVPPGIYDGQIALRADAEDGSEIRLGAPSVALRAEVLARAEMSISGTAANQLGAASLAPAAIHFPEARTGQSERVFINVWSNAPVVVSMRSRNRGILQHIEHPELPAIPYTASFRGSPLSLGGVSTFNESPPLSLSGAAYELSVTLGDITNRYAGRYRDVITVTVDQN